MFRSGMRPAAKLRAAWVPTRPFARPQRPGAVLLAATKAWESTLTGDEKSGHIAKSDSESILFFDSKFVRQSVFHMLNPVDLVPGLVTRD